VLKSGGGGIGKVGLTSLAHQRKHANCLRRIDLSGENILWEGTVRGWENPVALNRREGDTRVFASRWGRNWQSSPEKHRFS